MKEKIILQDDVENLGLAGEVVEVARGYARNYLFPRKLAVMATEANEKRLAATMASVEERKKRQKERVQDQAAQMEELALTVTAKVGESGKLFGSVTTMDIAQVLADRGHPVDRKRIELKSPIKSVGEHEISIRLDAGVVATLKLEVVPEEAS